MNILVLSWRDPKHPLSGGAEQVMHEHMKGWVKAGNRVTFRSSMFPGAKKEETIDGITITRSGNQLLGVQISTFIWYLLFRKEKYNLVVDQFHGIPFFTPLFVRTKKLAVLQEVAGKVWLKNDLPKPLNWIIGSLGYLIEPLIFLFYRKVPFITGSLSAREDLIKKGIKKENIHVINHGVLVDKSGLKYKKEKKKTILFLGALAKDKGVEDAIDTFFILDQSGDYNFWIVGKAGANYQKHLQNKVKKMGLAKKIKFHGFVGEKKKFELLKKTHILVNPSMLEGWGLVNIEANAMGTPVVAYRSPGLIDSVKEKKSGIICKQNSPSDMAREIHNILSSKKEYEKLQKSSTQWARNFSWKKSKLKSVLLIDKLKSSRV